MKFFLLLGLVLVGVWLFRSARKRADPPTPPRPPPPPAAPAAATGAQREAMVACAHCGLMLPAGEALPALRGPAGPVFCSEAHRAAAEAPTRP